MRQLSIALCAGVLGCGLAATASAVTPPLVFTLDLLAPCSSGGSCSGNHPTDMGFQVGANAFTYAQDTSVPGTFVATLDVQAPMVCEEIAANGVQGAATTQRFRPTFTNTASGGLLEFNAGGASVVDLNSVLYDGSAPAGVAASYSNYAATLPPQVTCYTINPVDGGPTVLAAGAGGIFRSGFEGGAHFADEPWVSVLTINSPISTPQRPGGPLTNSATQPGHLFFIAQIHNASQAEGWRVNLGYDVAFFGTANNGEVAPQWCVLTSLQPGEASNCSTGKTVIQGAYTVDLGDIQTETDSVYLQVDMAGSSVAAGAWNSLAATIYPATTSVFPKFGSYPQRFDDKSAVISSNNLPVLNVGSIFCNNDTTSTSCAISDADGNPITGGVLGQLNTVASITTNGAVQINPVAYFVDPFGGNTLPGTNTADAMTVSNASCNDPSGILVSPMSTANFTASNGSEVLDFTFKSSGGQYFGGTATCTATFTTPAGFSPPLSRTGSFTITMNQVLLGSVNVTAPAGPVAPGSTQTFNVAVANAGNGALANVAVTDANTSNFTITGWTCSGNGATCPNASGTGALSQTGIALPVGASLNYAVTGTVATNLNPTNQVTNAASISGTGLSCPGGNCTVSANVATVPIIAISMVEAPTTYTNVGDLVTFTITLTNTGGTDFGTASLNDPNVAGLAFGTWSCVAAGGTSACPNAGATGPINESNIVIGAQGGTVTYTLPATTTVPSGNITNTATLGLNGSNAICSNGICAANATLTFVP